MKYLSFPLQRKTLALMILALALLAGCAVLTPQRALASHPTIPATAAPDWVRDIIHDKCVNSGWNIVQLQWISPQGSPAATSVSVAYGASDVALTLNRITYRCKASSHSYGSFQIVSTSPSIGALNGMIGDMPYPGSANTYSSAALRDFNYPGPFTADTTINLTLNSRGTTTYNNGTHFCAVVNTEPRRPTPHQHNFTPEPGYCVQSNSSFTIQVNVGPPPDQPPTGSMSATCDTVSGRAEDPDRPGDQIRVHLYVNGAYHGDYPTDAGHNYSIDVSSFKGFSDNLFEVYAIGVDSAGNQNSVNPRIGSRRVGPCVPSVSCGTLGTSVGSPEASQPFTVRTRVNYSTGINGASPSRPTYVMTVSIPGIPYDENNAAYSATSSGATFTTPSFSLPAGRYSATWTFRGPSVNVTCSGNFIVVTKPYFRVYNGDAAAGFTTCPGWTASPSTGTIIGYNSGNGRGSAVQLAAFALSTINGFTSATGRTGDPQPAKGLSFANSPSTGSFGGSFGVGTCPRDYMGKRPAAMTALGNNVDVGTLASGSYLVSGDTTISGVVPDGRNIAIYVDGNAYIPSAGLTNDGSWTSLDDIPGFYLVVGGNLYIDNQADAIDGNFIAQPTSSGHGGEVYTCAFGFRGPSENELINDCQQQLEIHGSLTARHIRLARTNGSLRSSSNTEPRSSSTIAEVIIFTPEVWLTEPISEGNPLEYESITSLPPVL